MVLVHSQTEVQLCQPMEHLKLRNDMAVEHSLDSFGQQGTIDTHDVYS